MAIVENNPSLFQEIPQRTPGDTSGYAEIIGHPHANEGVFLEAIKAQQEAFASLPAYDVRVIERKALNGKHPEATDKAVFYEEKVSFSDGAVRTLTLGRPRENRFESTSPFAISGTDAWLAGPHGINRRIIRNLAESGYHVVWLHHQGRHSELPVTPQKVMQLGSFLFKKSIGQSAYHQHALFDDLEHDAPFDTRTVFSVGDSRGAVTGEAVAAIAPIYGRNVGYSDYIAGCFEHSPTPEESVQLAAAPLREIKVLGRLCCRMARDRLKSGDIDTPHEYLGTLDIHPLNIIHEASWILPLINGDAGKFARAVPLDSTGVRTLLRGDTMSQHQAWEAIHSVRPGIRFIIEEGSHLDFASQEIQQARMDRFIRLLDEMRKTDFRLPYVDFSRVIAAPSTLRIA